MFKKKIFSQLVQSILAKRSLWVFPRTAFRSHAGTFSNFWKISPLFLTLVPLSCAQRQDEETQVGTLYGQLEELTMPQLVKALHETPHQEFVIIIYDKFRRTQKPQKFAQQLKAIVQECEQAKVQKIYTISSRDAAYLNDIVHRLKNLPISKESERATSQTFQKAKKTFQCYLKTKSYSEAFQLQNSRDYSIASQIRELRHFQLQQNRTNFSSQLLAQTSSPFDYPRSIIVKNCPAEGECVQSFRRDIKKLLDEGMLSNKQGEYKFEIIVDHPTGLLLSKSTDYVRDMHSTIEQIMGKPMNKKEDIYMFRRDILGSQVSLWTEWLVKEGNNYEAEERMMMFLRPRVNIISKPNTFTDLLWYMRIARTNQKPSLSLNNTQKWAHANSPSTLSVLSLLHKHHSQNLNLLILNSKSVAQIFHHVYADHKWVLFQQSHLPVWNKLFLDLDQLENIKDPEQREKRYEKEFRETIESFLKRPAEVGKDMVVAGQQQEINLDKLKVLKARQVNGAGQPMRDYIIRVCKDKCNRYLKEDTLKELHESLKTKVPVYWIDSSTQNIGVSTGDYLLSAGTLTPIQTFLSNKTHQSKDF